MESAKKIIPMGKAELPPPGAARNEELAKRKDVLAQAVEERSQDMGAIDPEKLKPDHAVLHELYKTPGPDVFAVTDALPDYVYYWETMRRGGVRIKARKMLGWELVSGDMPEAREHLHVSGGRVMADDVTLMRIPRARWDVLQEMKRRKRAQQEGLYVPDDGLRQFGKVRHLGTDPVLNSLLSRETYSVTVKQKE